MADTARHSAWHIPAQAFAGHNPSSVHTHYSLSYYHPTHNRFWQFTCVYCLCTVLIDVLFLYFQCTYNQLSEGSSDIWQSHDILSSFKSHHFKMQWSLHFSWQSCKTSDTVWPSVLLIVSLAGEQSHQDNEPTASTAGRFQLRPSSLEKHAASLFKGNLTYDCILQCLTVVITDSFLTLLLLNK